MARKSANRNRRVDSELNKMLLKKAGSLLARRAYSRGELRDRLQKLAGERHVESVLDRLEELNLLNDADYAYNLALRRIRYEGWGPAKVHDSLLRRHVSPEVIDAALDRVRSALGDMPDLLEYIRKYCGKRWPPADARQLQRLVMHFRRRGFLEESILGALRRGIPQELLERIGIGE